MFFVLEKILQEVVVLYVPAFSQVSHQALVIPVGEGQQSAGLYPFPDITAENKFVDQHFGDSLPYLLVKIHPAAIKIDSAGIVVQG